MKKKFLLLSATVLSASIFISNPTFASTESAEKLEEFSFEAVVEKHFSEIQSDIKATNSKTQSKTQYSINNKQYLTIEEVKNLNFYELNAIYKELKNEINSDRYSENEINSLVAEKIRERIKREDNVSTYDYEIPGFGALTREEINLAIANPAEFVQYAGVAVQAKNEAEDHYGASQLSLGNGDAFRHAYWNSLMLINFAGSSGPEHGYNRAKAWADAHEANSSGVDKEMDLINNEIGRELGWMYYYDIMGGSFSTSELINHLKQMVSQGSLVRVVNGELFATNGVTGK